MDIKRLQELAGLEAKSRTVTEAYDDDEDPDVKIANADKRQREFEKKNAKELSAAEKAAKAKAEKAKAEKAKEAAPAAKAEEKKDTPAKAEEKKETAPTAKTKGRKTSERGGSCRTWLTDHPGATRGQFVAHCLEQGMSKAHANTLFYSVKKKAAVQEAFMIFHPSVQNFVLAENLYLKRYQWVGLKDDLYEDIQPLVFETEAAAQHVVNEYDTFGFTPGIITQVMSEGKLLED